jgi:hypothetical protein
VSYYEEDTRKKSVPLFIGIFLVVLSAISATFAANITINGSNRVEFGQAVYVVEACNGWIQISLGYGETTDGLSNITSFVINGLDTRSCGSTNITFKAYGGENQLDLYDIQSREDGVEPGAAVPVDQFTLRIDDQEAVSLVDADGTTIATDDPYISLDIDNASRTYVVGFTYPLATVEEITRMTVESGPNA